MQRQTPDSLFLSSNLNHFTVDEPFQQMLLAFGLPEAYLPQLQQIGTFMAKKGLEILDYTDKAAPPRLRMFDLLGQRLDYVQINPGHREVLEYFLSQGIINATFTEGAPWHFHFALGYLLADAGMYCTLTVTKQTAYALFKYGDEKLKQEFLPHFLHTDPSQAWYGATFYSETQAGSDLGANKAVARRKGDMWYITSLDKYFASNAGIADAALVTARPEGAPSGPKGLALFFVPAYRKNGQPNYRIRRLKEKLGTRSVPTGEVELEDAEGYLVGSTEQGIYIALEVLTVARIANAIAAMGLARKAYLDALLYTHHREAFGKKLVDHPLIRRDLLEMEVELEANLALTLKTIDLFNTTWQQTPPYKTDYHYTRLMGHIAKNMTAEASAWITRMAMECHGGIGFMEDFPIARWHRDALVTPIWEGASNIQALDLLEVIVKKQAHRSFLEEMHQLASDVHDAELQKSIRQGLENCEQELNRMAKMKPDEAQYFAKDLLQLMGHTAALALLTWLGERPGAGKQSNRFLNIARIYAYRHLLRQALPLEWLRKAEEIFQLPVP